MPVVANVPGEECIPNILGLVALLSPSLSFCWLSSPYSASTLPCTGADAHDKDSTLKLLATNWSPQFVLRKMVCGFES